MGREIDFIREKDQGNPSTVLRRWRTTILNGFFTITAIISLPALATIIVNAISKAETRPIALTFSVIELLVITLAVLRDLPIWLRVAGLWLLGYAATLINLMNSGLAGAGPLYLLVIPILILILLGKRAGLFTAVFSALVAAAVAVLIDRGVLAPSMLSRTPWMALTTLLMLLTMVMTLLILFYRFQEQLIANERQAQTDLLRAQALLEQQNISLEQKVRDRTEEIKSQQERAQEAQRRLADIINFLPDATLVIDREGKVIAWNRAIEEMSGIPAPAMLGRGDYQYAIPFYGERRPILIDLVHLPSEEIERKYAHIQRAGGILTGETYTPALKGGARYLFATASALHDANGNVVGAIETIRDITERKHAEEQLDKAKAEAEQANRAKSAFLATMSHEIRTPMNAVIGMCGLLLDTELSSEQHEYAETIRNSGDALLAVINDILDFSKIEAGKMDLERQPFDLRECVESALDLVTGRAVEKNLDLAYILEDDIPMGICGDVTRLRQILLNLLSNAVKFTEKGEVVLTVQKGTKPDELLFRVRDTGIGIPPDRMHTLFQSFSQADSSTTRRYGGTGLGLAISRRLVEMMGGSIQAQSEGVPGQGSTFSFTMRAERAEVPSRISQRDIDGLRASLQGKRLLIVDDNPTNRRILQLQTEKWGMQSRETGSPMQALSWLEAGECFDLAILDMHMPEMDGVELARGIRKLPAGRDLPLAMLTSLGRHEFHVADADFAAQLYKPLKPSQLFDALVSVFAASVVAGKVKLPAERPNFDPEMGKRHPLRILLAEDNLVNQKVALRILEQFGYRADIASNGKEALESVARQPYDVVLMDVQMPEMDGLEATRQMVLRWPTRENRPHIIALTADAMQNDRELCLMAGMDDYVVKPVRVSELLAALQKVQARN